MNRLNTSELTLTVDEVARLLRLARNSCYEAVRRGEIPSIRVGKRILIPKAALDHLLFGDKDKSDS